MIWTCMSWREDRKCNWCLKYFKFGILVLTFFLQKYGNCDKSSSSLASSALQHSHSPWKTWSTSESEILPWDAPQMPNIVPLTITEHNLREAKALQKTQNKEKSIKGFRKNPQNSSKMKQSQQILESNGKEKSSGSRNYDYLGNDDQWKGGNDEMMMQESKSFLEGVEFYPRAFMNFEIFEIELFVKPNFKPASPQVWKNKEDNSSADLALLREKALDFGSLVATFLSKKILKQPSAPNESRGTRGILADITNKFRINRQEGGGEDGGGDRGVIDWLARLIGVQGKTLGEFLREYQVHVLYDLVFTFFKWIFFLYAGLLIP